MASIPQEDQPRNTKSDLNIHLIADNYAIRKHPEVKTWLVKYFDLQALYVDFILMAQYD